MLTGDSIIFTCDGEEQYWNYDGSGQFLGIRNSVTNVLAEVYTTFTVMGVNGSDKTTAFTVELGGHGDDLPDPSVNYTSTVNVYDLTGSILLFTWSESGSGSCPSFRLVPSNIGLSVSGAASNDSWLYSGSGSVAGYSLSPGSTSLAVRSGSPFTSGGYSGQNYVLNLYLVLQTDISTGSDDQSVSVIFSGIADFIITPLMAFFNVEFIPGFSFSRIAMLTFVLGLVWWFLKVSK